MTKDKEIIGFEVDKEFKDRIIKACKNFKIDGVSYPLKLSGLCRIAVENFLRELNKKETRWQEK